MTLQMACAAASYWNQYALPVIGPESTECERNWRADLIGFHREWQRLSDSLQVSGGF